MQSFTLREWNIHLVLETFEPVISICSILPFGNGTLILCWKLLRL